MKNVDNVIDPRQRNDTIPGSFILIPQLENTRANERQWPVVAWPFTLLQLPKLECKVLPHILGQGLEDFPGVVLPSDDGARRNFRWTAPESD